MWHNKMQYKNMEQSDGNVSDANAALKLGICLRETGKFSAPKPSDLKIEIPCFSEVHLRYLQASHQHPVRALPKALQQLSDTNMFLKPCTSLLLTTLMMQVHKREANFRAIYGVEELENQQNNTFAKEEKVKQVGKRPFGRFC